MNIIFTLVVEVRRGRQRLHTAIAFLPDICARFRCKCRRPGAFGVVAGKQRPEVSSLEPKRKEHCNIKQLSGKLGFAGPPDNYSRPSASYDPALAVLLPLCADLPASSVGMASEPLNVPTRRVRHFGCRRITPNDPSFLAD